VPVALEGEEATISLDQEMQKAYAAYAPYIAAVADSAGVAIAPEVETASGDNSSSPEVAPVVDAAPVENFSAPEVATFVADAGASPTAFAESDAFAEPVNSAVETVAADPAGPVVPEARESRPQELQPVAESEPAMAEAASASSGDLAPVACGNEHTEEVKPDPETVKSTAAAWASWRQIRDARKDGEVTQAQPKEFEVSESVPAEIAAAVAAGAGQIMQEPPAAPSGDAADVASIVESVLANLRPKLMEEISRKMAEKK
jgi:hypothetical protein